MLFIDDKESFYKYLYGNCHCANAGQSPDMRKLKYKLAKYFGCNRSHAQRYRDFMPNTFARRFGYNSWKNMVDILGGDVL